ncbi:hypothetical protein [Azohydromonas caseinilytica]|uniref:Uncharacterized protein n=1 Tax=Azohydromonas caseinilytica TaxID=2728836 RepID=A0A848FCT1_9BURK|nr:hypothetical protein [Azohydromonas caseinilytica]NML16786.1 hypothetical protein [Azohydromonas caseinilytica]
MHTLRAMALIERAVELSESGFPGDALAEACSRASREERQAVLCIVRSRLVQSGQPATPDEVMAALREMVRGAPSPVL